jgi:hypothetical protein
VGLVGAMPLAAQKTPPKPPAKAAPAKADTVKAAPAKPAPPPEVPKFAYLQGVARDSVHDDPLAGALIQVEGTTRMGVSDSLGRFLVDSIPPGEYRVVVDHPVLDTLGVALVTPKMKFVVNELTQTVIAVPSAEFFTSRFCSAAVRKMQGPCARWPSPRS